MNRDADTIYIVMERDIDYPFLVAGEYDNKEAAQIAEEHCFGPSTTFHVNLNEVESKFTDDLSPWESQRDGETFEEWKERVEGGSE